MLTCGWLVGKNCILNDGDGDIGPSPKCGIVIDKKKYPNGFSHCDSWKKRELIHVLTKFESRYQDVLLIDELEGPYRYVVKRVYGDESQVHSSHGDLITAFERFKEEVGVAVDFMPDTATAILEKI